MRHPYVTARLRPRRWSLRARVTAIASLIIAVAVTGGIVLLFFLQVQTVHRTLNTQLQTYLTGLTQTYPSGNWPQPLPPSTLDPAIQAQIVDDTGHVLGATRSLTGLTATYALPPGATTPVRLRGADGAIPTDVRVIANRFTINGQPVTIIVGTPTGILSQLNTQFVLGLLLGFPLIFLTAAAGVWVLVGRTLRPVEQIRHAVTDISSADLSRRVPQPDTDDEISRLARTMNDMLARLQDSAQRQRQFVADASHELRSPLAALRTTLDVGLAHPTRAPWPTIAARAAQQGERLEHLIHQLLLLAKADEHPLTDRHVVLDIHDLLDEVVDSTPTPTPTPTIHLAAAPAEPALVYGNHDHLNRLFRNIIDNAQRYAQTTITIHTATHPDTITITITDDGPGIPTADHERVFERFVRLDTSRDRSNGTSGLGLAIARDITTAHHGHIHVLNPPHPGTQILIQLPHHHTHPDQAQPTPDAARTHTP